MYSQLWLDQSYCVDCEVEDNEIPAAWTPIDN